MAKLTIMRGPSGSGKSTVARELASATGATVVSRDDLRVMIFPIPVEDYYTADTETFKHREKEVSVAQDALVSGFLRVGKDVIVDNTNIEWSFVKALAKIAYRYGAEVEVKTFDIPLKTALMRAEMRANMGGRKVLPEIIKKQHARFQSSKDKVLDKVEKPIAYFGTPGKPQAFLYDLDGTVYHMNKKRGPYDHNVDVDDPDPVVQEMVRALSAHGLVAIAMSGRKSITREKTESCLRRDDVPFKHLFMRADGDDRADNIIKHELFNAHVRDNYDVQFVLDDRDQVVDMWRAMGLKCVQVEPGDF